MKLIPYITLDSPRAAQIERVRETINVWSKITDQMILMTQFGENCIAKALGWAIAEFPGVEFQLGFKVAKPLHFEGRFDSRESWKRVFAEIEKVVARDVLLDCETALNGTLDAPGFYTGKLSPPLDMAKIARLSLPPGVDVYDVQILAGNPDGDFLDREQRTRALVRAMSRALGLGGAFVTGYESSPRYASDPVQKRLAADMRKIAPLIRPIYALALSAGGGPREKRWSPSRFVSEMFPAANLRGDGEGIVWATATESAEVGRELWKLLGEKGVKSRKGGAATRTSAMAKAAAPRGDKR